MFGLFVGLRYITLAGLLQAVDPLHLSPHGDHQGQPTAVALLGFAQQSGVLPYPEGSTILEHTPMTYMKSIPNFIQILAAVLELKSRGQTDQTSPKGRHFLHFVQRMGKNVCCNRMISSM